MWTDADIGKGIPTEGVPPLLKQAVPLHDVVKVDCTCRAVRHRPRSILFVLERTAGRPHARSEIRGESFG